MDDRYSRQRMFKEIGTDGQEKIKKASITIIGVGALGSVSADLLTRAGIGKLILFDNDKIEESNLQRQSLYEEKDIFKYKVEALKNHLEKINSTIKIEAVTERVTSDNIDKIKADVIIDGADNMETRFLLNEYSKKIKTPFVYGSVAGSIGIVYNVQSEGACLNCIFKDSKSLISCENEGIINTASHTVSSLQVTEALKFILKKETCKEIIRFDIWKNSFEKYKVKKNDKCEVCSGKYKLLGKKDYEDFVVSECKTKSAYTAKPKKKMKLNIKNITRKFETLEDAGIIAIIKSDGEEIIVHDYGEILFKTLTDEKKIKEIAKNIYLIGKT